MKAGSNKVKLMICDDHPIVTKGVSDFLEDYKDVEIVGQFHNGKDLLNAVKTAEPHIILLDVQMPGMSGAEVLEKLNKNHKEIKVIIFSTYCGGEDICIYYIEKGACAVVSKDKSNEELARTIIAVLVEGSCVPETILKALLKKEREFNGKKNNHLSPREEEIIKLICKEKSEKEIAEELNISVSTVKFHKINLLQKTNSTKSAGLFKYALKRGLIGL